MTKEITTEVIKNFRADFAETVKDLEKKYGFVIDLGNIRYDPEHFSSKLEVTLSSVNPNKKYEDTFKAFYKLYGLEESYLGKEFKSNGINLTFIGLDNKKRNYPCICNGSNGKQYKLSIDQLKLYLSKSWQDKKLVVNYKSKQWNTIKR